MKNKNELYSINKAIKNFKDKINNLEKRKERIIEDTKSGLKYKANNAQKTLEEIKKKEEILNKEIEVFLGEQPICIECLYGEGEDYPDEKLGCTLMNYCMNYNGDLTLDELLKKEIKQKGE